MTNSRPIVTVRELVDQGVLDRPMDGNHGEIHPKGEDFIPSGVPFITAADIKNGRADIQGCAFISETQARSLRKGFAKLGDVLLTHKASIGRTAVLDHLPDGLDSVVLTPQVTYYRVLRKEVLDPKYLRFYFDSPPFQRTLEAWSGGGSTRAYLGITKQLDLPIQLLSIEQQRAIAGVLGSLDDKIEQNRRTAAGLEKLAGAIFRAWFVDFEPVHAKAAGAASFPGMPPAVFDSLPTRLVDSELGPIPEGWGVEPLGEIVEVAIGGVWGKDERTAKESEAVCCLRGIDCHDIAVGKLPSPPTRWISPKQIESRLVPEGSILVEGSGSFCGRSLWWASEYQRLFYNPVVYSNFCKRLDPLISSGCSLVAWYTLRDAYEQGITAGYRTGTAFPNLDTPGLLQGINVIVPNPESVEAFATIHQAMSSVPLVLESRKLAELRDYLLPKLLSGEVRVKGRGDEEAA